jgi:hypothetical protein
MLITYIILFSWECCSLENKSPVEETKNYYLRVFERYTYSTNSSYVARRRMTDMMHAVFCVREMAAIKRSRAIAEGVTTK